MASARAEAARALCGAFQPPTLGLCVAPLDDGSDAPSHVHLREALSKAVAQLEDTGSVVHAFKVTDTASCHAKPTHRNLTFDAVIPIRAGHVFTLPIWWPFCFYRWHMEMNVTFGTARLKQRDQIRCRPKRLALGIAGLARTFPHPIVHETIRGHLLDALSQGRHHHAVFGALRLEDERLVQGHGGGGRAMEGASAAAVQRALARLGADPRDVVVRQNATIAVPACASSTATGVPCTSYSSRCALPTVAAQIWSRRTILELIDAHERRESARFDSVIFMRPDLAVVVPFLPLCDYASALDVPLGAWEIVGQDVWEHQAGLRLKKAA